MTRHTRKKLVFMNWNTRHNIAICICSILATLFFLECAGRFYQYIIRHRTIEDSYLHPCYRHYFFLGPSFKPNSGGSWQSISDMKINSFGFRGDEFNLKKDKEKIRIICFGGSTSHSGNYPEKLQHLMNLNKDTAGRVEVINAACPTWTTTQDLIRFISQAIYLDPDIIIIYEAINDSFMEDYYWLNHLPEVHYKDYGGFFRRNSILYNFALNKMSELKTILWFAKWNKWQRSAERKRIAALFNNEKISNQVFHTDIENFIVLALHRKIKVVLVTMALNCSDEEAADEELLRSGNYGQGFEIFRVHQLNEVLRSLAKEYNVTLIDAEKSGMNRHPDYFADLCHFTERGASVFAKMIKDELDSKVLK